MSKVRMLGLVAVVIGICGAAFGDAGPVAYWRLDEAMGNTAYDWVGGNHGTLVGDANWLSGIIGSGALEFDGASEFVLTDTSPFDFANTTFTVSAWFCARTGGTIIAEGAYMNGGWYVSVLYEQANVVIVLKAANTSNAYTATSIQGYNDGLWHHLVAVITTSTTLSSGNHASVYVDGLPVALNEEAAYPYKPSTALVSIGARDNGARQYFGGLLDEIIVFDTGLSADEAAAIYLYGLAGHGYPTGPQPSINMLESVLSEKEALLEKMQLLMNREMQVCQSIDEMLAVGFWGDLKKADVTKARQNLTPAMQQQRQAWDAIDKAIDGVANSMGLLGWQPGASVWWQGQ